MSDRDDALLEALGALYAEQTAETEAALDAGEDAELEAALAPLTDEERARIGAAVRGQQENVLPFRRRIRGVTVLAPMLAAAVLLLALWGRGGAPRVGYSLELTRGGDVAMRGAGAEARDLGPGLVQVLLRPERPVEGRVEVQATFHTAAGDVPWAVEVEQAPTGVLRVEGERPALPVGPAALVVVLKVEGQDDLRLTQDVVVR